MQLFDVSPYLDKKECNYLRKRIYDIGKIQNIYKKLKNKLR